MISRGVCILYALPVLPSRFHCRKFFWLSRSRPDEIALAGKSEHHGMPVLFGQVREIKSLISLFFVFIATRGPFLHPKLMAVFKFHLGAMRTGPTGQRL